LKCISCSSVIVVCLTLIISILSNSKLYSESSFEKPYNNDNPILVDKGVFQLTVDGDYARITEDIDYVKVLDVQGRIGLGKLAEFGMDFYNVYIKDKEGYEDFDRGDLYLWTKIKILKESDHMPLFSFKSQIKVPTAADSTKIGSDETDIFLIFMSSKAFGKFRLNASAGMEILGDPDTNKAQNDGFTYGITAEYRFCQKLKAAVELYGDFLERQRDSVMTAVFFVYSISDKLDLFAGLRVGLNNDSEKWGGYLGLSYKFALFDFLHEKGYDPE
jgi:hypothetical protein